MSLTLQYNGSGNKIYQVHMTVKYVNFRTSFSTLKHGEEGALDKATEAYEFLENNISKDMAIYKLKQQLVFFRRLCKKLNRL